MIIRRVKCVQKLTKKKTINRKQKQETLFRISGTSSHFFWWTISFSFPFISSAGAVELDSMLRCLRN